MWLLQSDQILTPKRLTYAWITGGLLWLAWLTSTILGPGKMDLAGQVVGTDYLQFYSAGVTLQQGESSNLYDFTYQSQVEQEIAGPGLTSFHAFITPPFFALLFVPLSFLTYTWSFVVWSVLGLLLLWLSIKIVIPKNPLNGFLWSLTWFPVFAAISFGQNSLLSLFLFSLAYWLIRKEKLFFAGLVSSLLLFKPQLVFGLVLLWVLEYRQRWKSLLGLALGGSFLAGLSFLLLPDASRSYIDLSRNFLPQLIYQSEFPLWHLHSLRGFWVMLLPGQKLWAEALSLLLSAIGVVAYYLFWRMKRNQPDLLFAAAIILTIWISPHSMIYDWSILLIPALIFWNSLKNSRQLWKSLYALVWIATFISGPLAFTMLKSLHFALQISIPCLAFTLATAYKAMLAEQNQVKTVSIKSQFSRILTKIHEEKRWK